MKGMIIMADTYCHEGYSDAVSKEEKSGSKLLFTGSYVLFALAVSAVILYANAYGIYFDPASL